MSEEVQNRPLRQRGRKRKSADGGNIEVSEEAQRPALPNSISVQELLVATPPPELKICGYNLLEQYANAIVNHWKNLHMVTIFFLIIAFRLYGNSTLQTRISQAITQK